MADIAIRPRAAGRIGAQAIAVDQSAAISAAARWYRGKPRQPFLLTGPAGTGKTTIARTIADRCAPDKTVFLAPTGKAAAVLRSKGCDATTIHAAIYVPAGERAKQVAELRAVLADLEATEPTSRRIYPIRQQIAALTSPRWTLRPTGKAFGGRLPRLIIVDEASMVGESLAADVASFGVPVLALGDPYQLPPVGGGPGYPGPASAELTTTHRFGDSAPLMDLATAIRTGHPVPAWDGTAGAFTGAYRTQHLARFSQIICGRNSTRWALTNALRAAEGRQLGVPEIGDVVMVLRNDPDHDVVNGQQARLTHVEASDGGWSVVTDCGHSWTFDPRGFIDQEGQDAAKSDRNGLVAASFGAVVTCHKSQGSQWNTVAVVDESQIARKEAARWLYTAATRATQQCIVLRRLPSDLEKA